MEILQWLTGVTISLGLLLVTVQLVRKRKLREEHALLWVAACGLIFLLSLFPSISHVLAELFSVTYTPTLLLVLGLVFALAIVLSHSVLLTGLTDRQRDLTQTLALLDWQVRQTIEQLQLSATEPAKRLAAVNGESTNHTKKQEHEL